MGAFVLGILVGWLAEWLFYTFVVNSNDGDDDCSHLKAELEAKNRQISSLQDQISSSSGSKAATTSNVASTTSKKPPVAKKKKTTTSAKTASKAKAKTATRKTTTAKKTNTKKATRKATPKKAAAKPKSTARKTTGRSTARTKSGDDFTRLSGIGPSMAATLKSLGIDTYEKLASTDDGILRDMLEASGARLNNNKEAMDTWNEQAAVAARGDFNALKIMQERLKK